MERLKGLSFENLQSERARSAAGIWRVMCMAGLSPRQKPSAGPPLLHVIFIQRAPFHTTSQGVALSRLEASPMPRAVYLHVSSIPIKFLCYTYMKR